MGSLDAHDTDGDNDSSSGANAGGATATGTSAIPHPTFWKRVGAVGSGIVDGVSVGAYGAEAVGGALATPETGPAGAGVALAGTAKAIFSADDVAGDYQNFQGYDLNESVFTSAIRQKFGDQAADAYAAAKTAGNIYGLAKNVISFVKLLSKAPKAIKTLTKAEPVSVATGEYLETWEDYHVPAEIDLSGARYMGLQLDFAEGYTNPFGKCQITLFDEIFIITQRGKLDFVQADGKRVTFDRPFNFLISHCGAYPHLELRSPWLKQLELRDDSLVKHFRQYEDRIYRLEKVEDLNGNAITLYRSESGVLERVQTTDGLALRFSNDTSGHRTRTVLVGVDGSELELARYAYDSRGRMSGADCTFGMSVRYYWNTERDLLLSWHNTARRSETHFTYDDEGRVLHTRTNGIWNDDRFRYDPDKRETTYLPSGDERLAQRFDYDEDGNVTCETDALGHSTRHAFDRAGFETSVTDANGNTTSKAYDVRGNVTRFTDAEGRATISIWGRRGTLDMLIDGAGKIRRWQNDQHGRTLVETCANGHSTRFVRDARGRVLRIAFADGAEESRAYDEHGRLLAITDARGGISRFAYDPFGRVVEQTDALGLITRFEYGAGGGFATPTAMTRPDGVRVERSFAGNGALATVTDGEGRMWRHTYGAFDLLQSVEDPGGGKLAFAYDGEGRLTTVENQTGATYRLVRNAAGQIIAEEDFDGRRTTYGRDPGGRVVELRKPDGARLSYGYDKTDRITSIKSFAPDASAADAPLDETYFWYDRRGLLVKASNRMALVEFERDGNGRVVSEKLNGRTIESKLDAHGNRIERHIGPAQAGADRQGPGLVKIGRDPLGMVTSIAIDDHAPLAFSRDALGRETARSSTRGFHLAQTFDAVGQLLHQRVGTGAVERRYTWDKAGAPTTVSDTIWGQTSFLYDANGQVTKAGFGDGLTEHFAYDPARNVTGVALQGPGLEPSVAKLFGWQSSAGGVVQLARGPRGETVALTHDACGRVIERRVDRKGFRPRIWHYGWDTHDRLVRCDNPDGETWFYGYDPFGRRSTKVRKLSERELAWTAQKHAELVPASAREATKIWTWAEPPGGTASAGDTRPPVVGTYFQWDGDVVAEEAPLRLDGSVDWDEATRWHFEPDSFRPLAKQTAQGRLLSLVTDHLGTPREMVDEQGDLAWAASFTTWGVVKGAFKPPEAANDDGRAIYPRGGGVHGNLALAREPEDAQYDCPIRFQGQWADAESDLYYNRYRYYDPLTEQYLSPDPTGLHGGVRPQAYAPNALVNVDPLGLQLAANAKNGRAWEKKVANYFRQKGYTVYEQVTVTEVKSGKRIRLDGVVVDKNGKVVQVYDAKASTTAGLTPNQTEAYPNLTGGTGQVIPSGGNAAQVPGWSAGTPVTVPGSVTIIDPTTIPQLK